MKRTYIFGTLGVVVLAIVLILTYQSKSALKEFDKTYSFAGDTITLTLYTVEESTANSAFKSIQDIYDYYTKLVDKDNHYDDITNLYDIKNNTSTSEYLKINENLVNMIKLENEWSTKTNCNIKVTDDCTIAVLQDNTILNNHLSINLDDVLMGYVSGRVASALGTLGIDVYQIKYDNSYALGKYYKTGKYLAPIRNNTSSDVFMTLKLTNKSVITRESSIDGIKSVTVLGSDTALTYLLGGALSKVDIASGKELIKGINVDVIWYNNDDNIIKTDGVSDYE